MEDGHQLTQIRPKKQEPLVSVAVTNQDEKSIEGTDQDRSPNHSPHGSGAQKQPGDGQQLDVASSDHTKESGKPEEKIW